MVTINLLPWRAALRRHQRKALCKLLFGWGMLAVMILVGVRIDFLLRQKAAAHSIAKLHAMLTKYQKEDGLTEDNLIQEARIKKILGYAAATEQLLQSLARKYDNLCFVEIKRDKKSILFQGSARSAPALTVFLQNWRGTVLFSEIHLNTLARLKSGFFQFDFVGRELSSLIDVLQGGEHDESL